MTDEETEWIVEWPAEWKDVEWTEEDIQEFFDELADEDWDY